MNKRLGKVRSFTIAIAGAGALAAATSAAAGPSFTISVTPTQLILVGSTKGTYAVVNPTKNPITLTAKIGNYTIEPNGRVVIDPKVPPKRSAKRWLTVSPTRFTVKANGTFVLKVRSHPGRKVGPGDHQALVLLVSATRGKGNVLFKTRIGVGALVRIKGKIKRRLVVHLSAVPRKHELRLVIVNGGNLNERLLRHRVTVVLKRGSRGVQKLWATPRQILPHSRTVYALHYRSGLQGRMTGIVTVRPANGALAGELAPPLKPITRTFRVRL